MERSAPRIDFVEVQLADVRRAPVYPQMAAGQKLGQSPDIIPVACDAHSRREAQERAARP